MPDDLKHLPLWYERDQPFLPFHACTPEQCNRYELILLFVVSGIPLNAFSCVSSRRQAGIGHHLNPAVMPGHHQCPTCGTTCSVCANSLSVHYP